MAVKGWIKLWRRLSGDPMWTCEPFTKGQAWADLLMLANYTPGHIFIRGVLVEYDRGEIAVSERFLSERWMWSKGKVRRFLDVLETKQRIVTRKSSITSIIAITNYIKYQGDGNTDGNTERPPTVTRADRGRTAGSNADGPKKKEVKKEKKVEEGKEESLAPAVQVPSELNTKEFARAWGEWTTYRAKKRNKLLPESWQKQINRMAKHGAEASVAAIEHSIANGYQGVFPENFTGGKHGKSNAVGPGQVY
ncbi:hypothetical protein LCGC14_2106550, partial [marine sediment metagenome]